MKRWLVGGVFAFGCGAAGFVAMQVVTPEPAAAAKKIIGGIQGLSYQCSPGFVGPRKQLQNSLGGAGGQATLPNYTCVGPKPPFCEGNLWWDNTRVENGVFKYDCHQPTG